jgi:hypothetical protein
MDSIFDKDFSCVLENRVQYVKARANYRELAGTLCASFRSLNL